MAVTWYRTVVISAIVWTKPVTAASSPARSAKAPSAESFAAAQESKCILWLHSISPTLFWINFYGLSVCSAGVWERERTLRLSEISISRHKAAIWRYVVIEIGMNRSSVNKSKFYRTVRSGPAVSSVYNREGFGQQIQVMNFYLGQDF